MAADAFGWMVSGHRCGGHGRRGPEALTGHERAAHSDELSVYAAWGGTGLRGGPRCHDGYFGSLLNFDADQK
ncbi:hypothetical protein GCM10010276_51500 [Streptomyces longisporus]|uniref:C2H2-type domain-containing protein n=1 Tax=Streptomyces longisporus TaxID=1948 RepID=A0ABN3MHP7_STRLO